MFSQKLLYYFVSHGLTFVPDDSGKNQRRLRSGNLAGTQAAGAYADGGVFAVNNSLYLSDVRLPSAAAFSIGVGNIVPKTNCLIAIFTFCHIDTPV